MAKRGGHLSALEPHDQEQLVQYITEGNTVEDLAAMYLDGLSQADIINLRAEVRGYNAAMVRLQQKG